MVKTLLHIPLLFFLFSACDTVEHNDEFEDKNRWGDPWDDPWQWEDPFEPGEYGYGRLIGVESLFNIGQSNDGRQYFIVRERPTDDPFAPPHQLWIVDENGENPRYLAGGIFNADWSMDDDQLAVTLAPGVRSYIVLLDLEEHSSKQMTGQPDHPVFNEQTEVLPQWYDEDSKLLITVHTKSYNQEYEMGGYFINLQNNEIEGPVTRFSRGNQLGANDRYIVATDSNIEEENIGRNVVRYDLESGEWEWVSMYHHQAGERLTVIRGHYPDPRSKRIAVTKRWKNSVQLFLYDEHSQPRQLNTGGAGPVCWNHDSTELIFLRDIHKGKGAQFVPFRHNLETGETEPLWPHLPGYAPEFPELSTQDPIPISIER